MGTVWQPAVDDRLREPSTGLDLGGMVGVWYATDLAADGVVRLVLAERAGHLSVQVFGAGDPEPYEWGEVTAEAFGAGVTATEAMAFSATYSFDFVTVLLAAYAKQGILVLDTFSTFSDASGRANYFTREFFHR